MALHDGHRQRIIRRLDEDSLEDHELLEILLFIALPRKNTNDLAHRLLAEFGTVPRVLSATLEQLQRVDGVGVSLAAHIKVCGKICQRFFANRNSGYIGKFDRETFFPYVMQLYAKETHEVMDVYLLDFEKKVFGYKRFTSDKLYTVRFAPEDFAKMMVEDSPAGIVLVHNHPFGEAKPSSLDDEMTKKCQLLCSAHNIMLCDHIVYSPDGIYSYYLSGRLKEISELYSTEQAFSRIGAENNQ